MTRRFLFCSTLVNAQPSTSMVFIFLDLLNLFAAIFLSSARASRTYSFPSFTFNRKVIVALFYHPRPGLVIFIFTYFYNLQLLANHNISKILELLIWPSRRFLNFYARAYRLKTFSVLFYLVAMDSNFVAIEVYNWCCSSSTWNFSPMTFLSVVLYFTWRKEQVHTYIYMTYLRIFCCFQASILKRRKLLTRIS